MPPAVRKVFIKRSAALATAVALVLTALTIAAPSASAGAPVTPSTQTQLPGGKAQWRVTWPLGATAVHVSFGDGTSKPVSESWGIDVVVVPHRFQPPCTARSHTYTQHWTQTRPNGSTVLLATTTVYALYSGPLC